MSKKKYVRDKEGKIHLIFETFTKLVNKNGYDKLSTRHISKEAGISVGTIYHYFPGGKHAIACGFIEHITHQIFNANMFENIKESNLHEVFVSYVRRHLKVHRDNFEIHRAIDQAILANENVFKRHMMAVESNIHEVTKKLKHLDVYADIPENSLFQILLLFHNLLEAIVHRHLFFNPIFDTDEELTSYLVNILIFQTKNAFKIT